MLSRRNEGKRADRKRAQRNEVKIDCVGCELSDRVNGQKIAWILSASLSTCLDRSVESTQTDSAEQSKRVGQLQTKNLHPTKNIGHFAIRMRALDLYVFRFQISSTVEWHMTFCHTSLAPLLFAVQKTFDVVIEDFSVGME